MKKSVFLFSITLIALTAHVTAQTVVVTDDATYVTGQASSVLDIKSITRGLLIPRLTTAQRTAVASPAEGLLVYQTDGTKGFYYFTNSAWTALASGSGTAWSITGNTGTSPATSFLGTTDNTSLRFRTNNTQKMIIDSLGNVGIGAAPAFTTGTFQEKLLVDAGITGSYNAIVGRGTINNYLQLNIQNLSNGLNASSDVVATADNGNESINYVDLGINSSTNTQNIMGAANDGYLYTTGNNFLIGTGTAAKSMIFLTGGTTQSTNERMRINGSGDVGIGVSNPANPLVVKDTLEIRRTGALSELLFSNTSGTGDFRIAGDGGDFFWQGGGGRNLQMGAFWGVILGGDRQTGVPPSYSTGVANTGVLVLAQRDVSVPLAVQANSATQTANLTEWRSSTTTLDVVDKNGNIGIGTTSPATALHVAGTNPLTLYGVQPGATSDSILTIASGTVRKLPYSTVTSGSSWSLTGNTGTNFATNFLGTTDNTSMRFRTNNTQKMIIDSLGNVGIGAAPAFTAGTFQEKLLVDAGVTGSYNAIVGRGTINNYLQLNIQNLSNGLNASSDVVATSDNGNESINYVDMGINSSTNTQNIMGAANDAYLYSTGNNFLIGNGTAAKALVFLTGGTTQSTNERMRIDGTGNVGIGKTAPAFKLDVHGKVNADSTVAAPNYTSAFQTLIFATTTVWDQTKGATASVTLTGNSTLSITNASAGMFGMIKVQQDGTGSRTLTLPGNSKVINGGGGAVILTTTASAVDVLSYFYDGTNYYWTVGYNYN